MRGGCANKKGKEDATAEAVAATLDKGATTTTSATMAFSPRR